MESLSLACLRNKKGLTQRQLAKELELSLSTIAMYETGERTPPLKRAKMIANFFNRPVDDIIFGKSAHISRAKQVADYNISDETCCTVGSKIAG